MNRDSRLSSILHVLLHMAHSDRPLTSDELAAFLGTHSAFVRRELAGLRELGYVRSEKGHGGGWTVSCDLSRVSLRDIFDALGTPQIFAIGDRNETPTCLVEQAVNSVLGDALRDAEALLMERLGQVMVADLAAEFTRRLNTPPHCSNRNLHDEH